MKRKIVFKYLILVICYFILVINILFTVSFLFFDFTLGGLLLAMILPVTAPMLILTSIIPVILIIRLQFYGRRKYALIIVGICGFLVVAAYLPYFALGIRVFEADAQMINEYGAAYSSLDTTNMRMVPFSLWDSMVGIPIDESLFTVETDIPYVNTGSDTLYFDYYAPTQGAGPFPVIITIHGGAWCLGNKGRGNSIVFNKYFASKGYVVFDIQYGLYDLETIVEKVVNNTRVINFVKRLLGSSTKYNRSYTIQQQVENIGNFTHFISKNASVAAYNINLNRIFVTGRSAGGHLALVTATGYKNSLFAGNFSSNITIKGVFSFYGPSDMKKLKLALAQGRLAGLPSPLSDQIASAVFDSLLEGSSPLEDQFDKLSAAFLIRNTSLGDVPPLLILHGDKDNLCPYIEQSWQFHQSASNQGIRSILVTIPFFGHTHDIVFQSYGAQMSVYYIERFLALEGG